MSRGFAKPVPCLLAIGVLLWAFVPGAPQPSEPKNPQAGMEVAAVHAPTVETDHALLVANDLATDGPSESPAEAVGASGDVDPGRAIWDCVEYDVVQRVVEGVGRIDGSRVVHSLQLNPACRPVDASFALEVLAKLEAYAVRDRQIQARLQAALCEELADLARHGLIPVMGRDFHPEIHDRVESRCRKAWKSMHRVDDRHDWESDTGYRTFRDNELYNELARNTKHLIRVDVGETGKTHIATYADCKDHVDMMMRGHRENLAAEAMQFLVGRFAAQGHLEEVQCEALWTRFEHLQGLAVQARLSAFR